MQFNCIGIILYVLASMSVEVLFMYSISVHMHPQR